MVRVPSWAYALSHPYEAPAFSQSVPQDKGGCEMYQLSALMTGDDSDVISDFNFTVYFVAIISLAAILILIMSMSRRR